MASEMPYTDEEKEHLGAQQAALIQLQKHQELQTKVQIQQAMLEADKEQTMVQTHVIGLHPPQPPPPMQQQFINYEEPGVPGQAPISQPGPPPMQPAPTGQFSMPPPPPGLAPPGMAPPIPPAAVTMAPPGVIMPPATSLSQPGMAAPLPPSQALPGPPQLMQAVPTLMSQGPPPSMPQDRSMGIGPPGTQVTPPPGMPPTSQPPMSQGPPPLHMSIGPPGVGPDSPKKDRPERPPMMGSNMNQGGGRNVSHLDSDPEMSQDADEPSSLELKLPQALEMVLAFKDVRAQQVGVKPEDIEGVETGEIQYDESAASEFIPGGEEFGDDEEEGHTEAPPAAPQNNKETKNKKKKKKKKKRRKDEGQTQSITEFSNEPDDDVEIEYIPETLDLDPNDPTYSVFAKIFENFKIEEPSKGKLDEKKEETEKEEKKEVPIKARGLLLDDDDDDEDPRPDQGDDDKPKISKKKLKKMSRLSVAELKQLVIRPDVVEMHDVTARDPKLLVNLKAARNTVTVPRHWCFKRKYLQGKRGIEKPPFELPDFIKATGIMEMRAALQEKEDQRSMKQKMRERVRPKMGKIDIDYQKLHDAFFRWQVKPKMTIHGDLYYEGKEFETRLKEKKPGNLSDDLRTALGMPAGPNAEKVPPPWLIAMQRYGPPPSYPNLKIAGLNAPIPDSCSFGYHAGGWGKPPVDENGKPLYGDVFGTQSTEFQTPVKEEEVDRSRWGELESESESEESESDEDDDDEEPDTSGLVTPGETGLITPSGVTSVPVGMETPDLIELRKKRIEDAMDQGGDTPALYTVLPEKRTSVGGAMMGSAHVYDMSAVTAGSLGRRDKASAEGVEIALNPDELDLDTAAMQAKYEQTMKEQQSQLEKEDLSDMVAEHAAKQKKRKAKQQDAAKGAKKYREFKF